MKKWKLMGAMALAVPSVATATPFADARSQGMAGASVAGGNYTNAAANPALLTQFDDNDDFYLQLGLGALARDYKDVIDDIDTIQDDIDEFEVALDTMQFDRAEELADKVFDQLESLDQEQPEARLGLILGGYRPSKGFAFGVTLNAYGAVSGIVNFDEDDRTVLDDALLTGSFDEDDLKTNADLQAALVTEIAVPMATEFNLSFIPSLAVGITPKLQRIDSYYYNANVSSFDEDDITDDDNMTDDTGFNLDIGVHSSYGPFDFGLVGRNLIEHEVDNINGDAVKLSPTLTAGAAVSAMGFTAEFDLDLIENESFDLFAENSQWARLGLEYNLFGHLQARAGYRTDLSDNYNDIITFGLGLSPFEVVSVDLTGQFGDDDEIGAQLQFGIGF